MVGVLLGEPKRGPHRIRRIPNRLDARGQKLQNPNPHRPRQRLDFGRIGGKKLDVLRRFGQHEGRIPPLNPPMEGGLRQNGGVDAMIAECKETARWGMEHFLMLLKHVPDDRLDWTPGPGTKSAMRIAAHTAVTAGNFAQMMRDRRLPMGDEIPPMMARTLEAELALTDRAEMEKVFRRNTDEVLAALESLSAEDIQITLDSGMGWTMPMTFLMRLPGLHAAMHIGQIDYLQTCWGDQEIHF